MAHAGSTRVLRRWNQRLSAWWMAIVLSWRAYARQLLQNKQRHANAAFVAKKLVLHASSIMTRDCILRLCKALQDAHKQTEAAAAAADAQAARLLADALAAERASAATASQAACER